MSEEQKVAEAEIGLPEAVDQYLSMIDDAQTFFKDIINLVLYLDQVYLRLKNDPLGLKVLAKIEAEMGLEVEVEKIEGTKTDDVVSVDSEKL